MLEASLHFSKASHGKQKTWKAPDEQLQISGISPKPEQFCSSRTRSVKADSSEEPVSEAAAGSLWHDPKSSKCFICSYHFLPLKEVICPGKLFYHPLSCQHIFLLLQSTTSFLLQLSCSVFSAHTFPNSVIHLLLPCFSLRHKESHFFQFPGEIPLFSDCHEDHKIQSTHQV